MREGVNFPPWDRALEAEKLKDYGNTENSPWRSESDGGAVGARPLDVMAATGDGGGTTAVASASNAGLSVASSSLATDVPMQASMTNTTTTTTTITTTATTMPTITVTATVPDVTSSVTASVSSQKGPRSNTSPRRLPNANVPYGPPSKKAKDNEDSPNVEGIGGHEVKMPPPPTLATAAHHNFAFGHDNGPTVGSNPLAFGRPGPKQQARPVTERNEQHE